MKIIKQVEKGGKKHVTVELSENETIVVFNRAKHYRVPDVDEVFHGESLAGAELVNWCQISQQWVN